MPTLLENRRHLTPQQSMQSLYAYAREQDDAIHLKKVRNIRAITYFGYAAFGILGCYAIYGYFYGQWNKIYPRSITSAQVEAVSMKRRQYFAPEIYLKDNERWLKDLREKQLSIIANKQTVSEQKQKHGKH